MNKKEIIVETAIKLFQKNGYQNTSVLDIVNESGISKATFYNYFPNKDEIIFEFQEQELNLDQDTLDKILLENNKKEKIWYMTSYALNCKMQLGPNVLKSFILTDIKKGMTFFSSSLYPTLSEDRIRFNELSFKLIKEGQKEGQIKKGNPRTMLEALTMIMIQILTDWSSNNGNFDPKAKLRIMFDLIF